MTNRLIHNNELIPGSNTTNLDYIIPLNTFRRKFDLWIYEKENWQKDLATFTCGCKSENGCGDIRKIKKDSQLFLYTLNKIGIGTINVEGNGIADLYFKFVTNKK